MSLIVEKVIVASFEEAFNTHILNLHNVTKTRLFVRNYISNIDSDIKNGSSSCNTRKDARAYQINQP